MGEACGLNLLGRDTTEKIRWGGVLIAVQLPFLPVRTGT
jgi:hypothetical protein